MVTIININQYSFNQLDLPDYPTREILLDKLELAILEGKEGFGFA
jgi:E3 ubiquitin-protein ligase HUWE1